MESSQFPALGPVARHIAPYIAAVVIGGGGIGYAVHEHHDARALAAQNAQVTAQLSATQGQLDVLTAKVSALASAAETKPAPAIAPVEIAPHKSSPIHRAGAQDARWKKLQSEVDAQGKEIEAARSDLASTRTELTGSIARTHDELVVLEKKGQRNYFEFDIQKSKDFKREGPVSMSLRKANTKRQYADLQLIVDDRTLSQKHVNLYQPVMFYEPETQVPVEVVINDITKNHIHGYVSAPKYRPSELASATDPDGEPIAGNPSAQPPARQKLPKPDPDQQ
jgi:hypothetical protein